MCGVDHPDLCISTYIISQIGIAPPSLFTFEHGYADVSSYKKHVLIDKNNHT